MTVCLPEGAELATNSRGRYVYTLSDRHTEDYSFTITKKENMERGKRGEKNIPRRSAMDARKCF